MEIGGYKIREQNAIHFVTFTVVRWIDIFTRDIYKQIIIDSLKFCQTNKGLKIHAWVIMTNHIHLIVSVEKPFLLSGVIRDFKKYTSFQITKALNNSQNESRKNWMIWLFKSQGEQNTRNEIHQFWQQNNHPILCDTDYILKTRLNYLHENPVRAEIVYEPADYVYSSAIDYYENRPGLIEIVKLDFD